MHKYQQLGIIIALLALTNSLSTVNCLSSSKLQRFKRHLEESINQNRRHVDRQVRPCSGFPCRNGAKCIDQPNTFYGYSCVCFGPWTGINCDINKDMVGSIGNNYPGRYPGDQPVQDNNYYPYNSYLGNNGNAGNPGYLNNPAYNLNPNDASIYLPGIPSGNNNNNYPNQNQFAGGAANLKPGGYSETGSCMSKPCYNEGQCTPTGPYSFQCMCRYNFYGVRCENYRNPKAQMIAIVLGTVLPFFALLIIASCCIYFCCIRKR